MPQEERPWERGGTWIGKVFTVADEFSRKAVENIVTHSDYQATLLHLFGPNHEKLVFTRNLQEASLVDKQPARIVTGILA